MLRALYTCTINVIQLLLSGGSTQGIPGKHCQVIHDPMFSVLPKHREISEPWLHMLLALRSGERIANKVVSRRSQAFTQILTSANLKSIFSVNFLTKRRFAVNKHNKLRKMLT